MNSQQELLEAINSISESKDRSFDTPATVLRIDGETVWVHIDGGADETPVRKTVNCEEGEIVQVRIANGSAFLVGNASAPPTDDKTANVAHFVAEQADLKATEAIRVAEAISQTVEGKVDIGDSNVSVLSSTMYQNANGVNIFNNTLAVGDSYAHIDGDSFDIREATTAGTIDDANDTTLASFGQEVTVGTRESGSTEGDYSQVFGSDCDASGDYSHAEGYYTEAAGDYSHSEGYYTHALGRYSHSEGGATVANDDWCHAEGGSTYAGEFYSHAEGYGSEARAHAAHAEGSAFAHGQCSHAEGLGSSALGKASHAQNYHTIAGTYQTAIGKLNIDHTDVGEQILFIIGNGWELQGHQDRSDALIVDWNGNVLIAGNVQDMSGNNKTPTILTSTTIASADTSYTFSNNAITADSVVDIYDTIFGFSPTAMTVSAGSCTITFPAQSSTHTIKLFVY